MSTESPSTESPSAEQELRHERTIAVIAEIVEVERPEIQESALLREDLGLDSLQSLELLSVLSEELRIDLPMEEAMELSTVADACVFVERAYQAQRGSQGQAAVPASDHV